MWATVAEFAKYPRDWDSYGAEPLKYEAVVALSDLVRQVLDNVQSAPRVSMLVDGGLLCEWANSGRQLDMQVGGDGEVTIQFEDDLTGEQFSRPRSEVLDLGKRLWEVSLG